MAAPTEKKSVIRKSIESYASHSVLVFSGSLMVLSITFNNIGLGKIIDAYAQQMVAEIEHKERASIIPVTSQQCIYPDDLMDRITHLEELSHRSSKL